MIILSKQNKKPIAKTDKKIIWSVIGLNILKIIIFTLTCLAIIKTIGLLLNYEITSNQMKNTVAKVIWSMISILLMFATQLISDLIQKRLLQINTHWNQLNTFLTTFMILVITSIADYILIIAEQDFNAMVLSIAVLVLNSIMISKP